jgi:hypothetical protein
MLLLAALVAMAPGEMRLPSGAMCPDAAISGNNVVYGDGQNGWYTSYGSDKRTKIDTEAGTVHAGGERGPKIALAGRTICLTWQGDYRQGPHVWFTRSTDGGKTFEPQRDLLDAKTPGLDHPAISANGRDVVVLWLDGRGGEDPEAPVTSTIWYRWSKDGGVTFSPSAKIAADPKVRPCACCSFIAYFGSLGSFGVVYRSGVRNERDFWTVEKGVQPDEWISKRVTRTYWKYQGCPMDGPRVSPSEIAYSIDGKCYAFRSGKPVLLGNGKYAGVAGWGDRNEPLYTWQEGETLHWRYGDAGESGTMQVGQNRAAVTVAPGGRPLIIH